MTRPHLPRPADTDTRRRLTLAACVLGSSLAFVDGSVVIVALPTMAGDLRLDLSAQEWIVVSYSLTLAALYLTAGAIGDRRGHRETFIWGIVGFAATSALAGVSPSGQTLILARALQGIAGAFLTVNSLALLREVYGREAGRAVGLWTALTGVATVAVPPLGGALVEWLSWRWVFFINLPLAGAAAVLAVAGRCPQRQQDRVGRLDVAGAVLAASGFGLLSYAFVDGGHHGFGRVWWAFAGSVAALAVFLWRERHAEEPMLPLGLFRRRNFAAANAETFLVYGALGGFLFFFTIYLQFLGFSAFQAGLANLPVSVVMILLATRFGRLADRHGPRRFLTFGPLLIAGGTLVLLGLDRQTAFWRFGLPGLLVLGLGLAIVVAPLTSTALSSAHERHSGIASGINQTISRTGNLVAVALLGAVVAGVFQASSGDHTAVPLARQQTAPALRDASVDAFRASMLIVAGLAVAGAAVGATAISDRDVQSDPADASA